MPLTEQGQDLLPGVIEALGQAVVAYDDELRLIAANRLFVRQLDLPDALGLPGSRFEDLVRHNALRGVYGKLAPDQAVRHWVARLRGPDEVIEESERPDGRCFEIHKCRMPGGYVLTYHDITERKQRERRLRDSERTLAEQSANLEAILGHMAQAVNIIDAAGRVILVNDGFLELYGFPPEFAQKGTPLRQFVEHRLRRGVYHPHERRGDDIDRLVERRVAELMQVGEETVEENQPDGRVIRIQRRRMPDGILISTYSDITEQRAAEQALRQSELRFRAVVEDQTDMIVRLDPELRITFVNGEFCRANRQAPDELVGHEIGEFLSTPGDAEDLRRGLAALTPERPILERVYCDSRVPGRFRWERWINRALFDEAGRVTAYQAVGRNVTARKLAEDALQESEARLRMISEAHPVPLLIVRRTDAVILHVSAACVPRLAEDTLDLIGLTAARLFVDPDTCERFEASLASSGRIDEVEVPMQSLNGTFFPAAVTARPLTFSNEPAVVMSIVDLTEQKRAEAELARHRQALHQSEKMSAMGSLLASVAHELNNPLSVVVGQAMMLEELAADTNQAERAGKIRNAAERCARIVKTFLAMARSRPPERQPVQLNRALESALEIAAYTLRSSGIEVAQDLDAGLPETLADGDQLHQVLLNLIINARQAMVGVEPPRRLEVSTRFEPAGRRLRIVVRDTGHGVPPELRERIFEPFFTTKPAGVGTGIGLSVSRRVVEAHGGRLWVEASVEGGAAFVIDLPWVACGEALAEEPAAAAATSGAVRILVVDDEPEIAELLAEILRLDGRRVDIADGGRGALARLAAQRYDLVISDLRMPDMDGPALYRALMAADPAMAERVMFVTGDTLGPEVHNFVAGIGAPVIEKPFDPERIRRATASHLAGLAGRGTPPAPARPAAGGR
jgi:PAS domain S-box-containing protein